MGVHAISIEKSGVSQDNLVKIYIGYLQVRVPHNHTLQVRVPHNRIQVLVRPVLEYGCVAHALAKYLTLQTALRLSRRERYLVSWATIRRHLGS